MHVVVQNSVRDFASGGVVKLLSLNRDVYSQAANNKLQRLSVVVPLSG